jgi:hypothetical protein
MGPGKKSATQGRFAVSKKQMARHSYLVDGRRKMCVRQAALQLTRKTSNRQAAPALN